MRRAVAALSGTLLLTAALTACSTPTDSADGAASEPASSAAGSPAAGGSPSASTSESGEQPLVVDVTFDGDSVEPNGDRLEVDRGQEVDLVVTADEPGEIHVHSSPEQELEYDGGGATQTFTMTFDRPGIVEVESHSLDQQIVSLEVE